MKAQYYLGILSALATSLMSLTALVATDLHEAYVSLKLSKTTYLTTEPMFVSVILANQGSQPFHYEGEDLRTLTIAEAGGAVYRRKSSRFLVERLPKFDDRGNRLDPRPAVPQGQSSSALTFNILDHNGVGLGDNDFYLPVGSYRIWNEKFPSETLFVSIVDPTSPSDHEAAVAAAKGIDSRTMAMAMSNDHAFARALDYYRRYPNSPYAETALRALVVTYYDPYPPGWSDSLQQFYAREMISRFPRSGYVRNAIVSLDPILVPPDKRGDFARVIEANLDPHYFTPEKLRELQTVIVELRK